MLFSALQANEIVAQFIATQNLSIRVQGVHGVQLDILQPDDVRVVVLTAETDNIPYLQRNLPTIVEHNGNMLPVEVRTEPIPKAGHFGEVKEDLPNLDEPPMRKPTIRGGMKAIGTVNGKYGTAGLAFRISEWGSNKPRTVKLAISANLLRQTCH
jgi:hypothetical protein